MNYIGITGHRGSGKISIAYLIGNIIEGLRRNNDIQTIKNRYKECCESLRKDNYIIYNDPLFYVYFEEFGMQPKYFISQLLGTDLQVLNDDYMKDTLYVNLKDFTLNSNIDDNFFKVAPKDFIVNPMVYNKQKYYMKLRDFIEVFSIDIMQYYFGNDIWIKSLYRANERFGEDLEGWKIFFDVKTQSECKYIKEHGGFIIKTIRPNNKKTSTRLSNTNIEADFILETEGKLEDLFDKIFEISNNIYKKTKMTQ